MRRIVDRIFCVENGEEKHYVEISGDSTETKPTADLIGGSLFFETDTGKNYILDEDSGDWNEYPA